MNKRGKKLYPKIMRASIVPGPKIHSCLYRKPSKSNMMRYCWHMPKLTLSIALPKRCYDSVFHWILNIRPLGVSRLNGHEAEERDSPFKEVLGSHLFKYPKSPLKPFLKTKGDDQTSYYDEGLQSGLTQFLSLIVLNSRLIAPICLVFLLELSRGLMVLVVLVFTILVYIVVTLGTPASQFEAFEATVAYCVFLDQFLGNLGRGN
ncbi:hypothetical protein EAF00_005005 [Botryotinia globosa]|nr:hypothetical protein EAF00_005005 [Botryotinia globosa]